MLCVEDGGCGGDNESPTVPSVSLNGHFRCGPELFTWLSAVVAASCRRGSDVVDAIDVVGKVENDVAAVFSVI